MGVITTLVEGAKEAGRGILAAFGLRGIGHNYRTLKARIQEEGLDWNNLSSQWRKQLMKRIHINRKKTTADLLANKTLQNRQRLKQRIIEEHLLPNKCAKCGIESKWMGENIILILDHINGLSIDNRLENLRLLCPNCNSQTLTFAGRNNRGKKRPIVRKCLDCGNIIGVYSLRCKKCYSNHCRRAIRPPIETLKQEIDKLGWEATGRKYGVSGNAIKKWIYSDKVSSSGKTQCFEHCNAGSIPATLTNL